MAKKKTQIKKKTIKKITTSQPHHQLSERNTNTEKILIENFVALQKVMTNLSVKFDSLSTQISKLLDLFEISAKALAEKETHPKKEEKESREIVNKIDNLFEQNKVIARGLTLLHEQTPQGTGFQQPPRQMPVQRLPLNVPRPSNQFPKRQGMEGYQRSITNEEDLQETPSAPKFKKLPELISGVTEEEKETESEE